MNALTFKDIKLAIAKYCGKAGKCADDDTVSLFALEVLQQLLYKGEYGNLRTWEFFTHSGMITAPLDLELPIKNGQQIQVDYVGKNLANYDSMLVLSHFKGHPMGGYGGSLKQLSIGCASASGKAFIHSAGKVKNPDILWDNIPPQDMFLESMADAAAAVVNYFQGNMAFINIMCNMSVDCDCCEVAEDPCLNDIGILASLDPVALDQACLDLVENSNDPGKAHFMERVNSRNGFHTIIAAEKNNIGSREYELININ